MGGVVSHPAPTSVFITLNSSVERNQWRYSLPSYSHFYFYHTEFFSGEKLVENNWERRVREGGIEWLVE